MDHNRLLRGLFRLTGTRRTLFKMAQSYADWYRGDENEDPETNGEYTLLSKWPSLGGGTVIDVGANQGDWAERLLRLHPNAAVHCFEPTRSAFNRLESRMADHAALNRLAVGETAGTLRLAAEGHDDVTSVYSAASIGARFPGSPGESSPP